MVAMVKRGLMAGLNVNVSLAIDSRARAREEMVAGTYERTNVRTYERTNVRTYERTNAIILI
jgi:hypothetical protein